MSRRKAVAPRRASVVDAGSLFAALGDGTRLEIVSRLSARGPMSIAGLTAGTRVTRQAVTKHLHVLADAGLVRGTRSGRDHVWAIEARRLIEARRWLDDIGAQWDDALARLKSMVEGED